MIIQDVDPITGATAEFDPDRIYRYSLTRQWDSLRLPLVFVMLNPSKADAFKVDPTVSRCIGFARAWGAGGLIVLNAYALRATDPKTLRAHPDPVGPDNDEVISRHLSAFIGRVVVAWGAHATPERASRVRHLIESAGHRPTCLGRTKAGAPRHPLYLRADSVAVPL